MLFNNAKYDNLRELYIGKRIALVKMDEDPDPIKVGEQGMVVDVDDAGQLGVAWDSGRTLRVNMEAGDVVKIIDGEPVKTPAGGE
jgi:hypothetical protein